jgi:hypothetical protein
LRHDHLKMAFDASVDQTSIRPTLGGLIWSDGRQRFAVARRP